MVRQARSSEMALLKHNQSVADQRYHRDLERVTDQDRSSFVFRGGSMPIGMPREAQPVAGWSEDERQLPNLSSQDVSSFVGGLRCC